MNRVIKFMRRPIASTLAAILVGFLVSGIVLAIAGYNPIECFGTLFYGALGKPKYIANVIIKATPILLTGVGVAFAFQTGLFNIGAEGQYIFATIVSSIVGIVFDFPPIIEVPLILISGIAAGALLGAFIGFLKAKFGIHEVITSIMMNWIMLYLNNFVVASETFHKANSSTALPINPSGYTLILPNWKQSDAGIEFLNNIPWLREVMLKTDINFGFIIGILVAIGAGYLLAHTKFGYRLRAVGANPDASRFAGIDVNRSVVLCMLISGAFCGAAGALNITGIAPHTIAQLAAQEGYGFNGLSVAFIAGCSCVGCIPASLFFAGLTYGGMSVQQLMGAPSDIISIMMGTIVFFVALPGITTGIADRFEARARAKELGVDSKNVDALTPRLTKDQSEMPEHPSDVVPSEEASEAFAAEEELAERLEAQAKESAEQKAAGKAQHFKKEG